MSIVVMVYNMLKRFLRKSKNFIYSMLSSPYEGTNMTHDNYVFTDCEEYEMIFDIENQSR